MKILFFFLTFMMLLSCSKKSKFSDDYILIEFASRLEEDYHKFDKKKDLNTNLENEHSEY